VFFLLSRIQLRSPSSSECGFAEYVEMANVTNIGRTSSLRQGQSHRDCTNVSFACDHRKGGLV